MKVYFTQAYISPGVCFPWSYRFQQKLSDEISSMVSSDDAFSERFGLEWDLAFYISAKQEIQDVEVRGPSIWKKGRSVEFTLFLPFDLIPRGDGFASPALEFLCDGIQRVFDQIGLKADELGSRRQHLVHDLSSDPSLLESS